VHGTVALPWSNGTGEVYYEGVISDYCAATEEYLVRYLDGDAKWHGLLQEERIGCLKWLDYQPPKQFERYDDTTPHYYTYNANTRLLTTCTPPSWCSKTRTCGARAHLRSVSRVRRTACTFHQTQSWCGRCLWM
jgi:hypothetical protein